MCGRCTRAWLPSLRSHTPPHSSYLSASTSFFYLPARPTHMCMCTLVFSVRSEPAENARYCYIIIIVIVSWRFAPVPRHRHRAVCHHTFRPVCRAEPPSPKPGKIVWPLTSSPPPSCQTVRKKRARIGSWTVRQSTRHAGSVLALFLSLALSSSLSLSLSLSCSLSFSLSLSLSLCLSLPVSVLPSLSHRFILSIRQAFVRQRSRCQDSRDLVPRGQRMRGYVVSPPRPLTASRVRGGPPV